MAQLRQSKERYARRRASVYAVTTGRPEHTREFCARHEVPFPCLVDRPGEPAYVAFGLEKTTLRNLFGPSLLQGVWTALSRWRETYTPASGDVFQLSGTFVVDAAGIVRFVHRDAHPGDHAADDAILACLDALASAS